MKKNPEEKMTPTKMYHIYAKEECLYNNLSETQFKNNIEDLSYEEVELIRQPKEEHSY